MKKLIFITVFLAMLVGCSRNAVTGRKQLSLIPEGQLQQMAVQQYQQFLSQSKVVNTTTNKDAEMVRRVGTRIANAISTYYANKGNTKIVEALKAYKWEFNLVDNKEVNAWCMPGGKVVVYTGLLPVAQNEAALAIVLGHEITHAVAGHGGERMSQAMLAQGLGALGDAVTSRNSQVNGIFNGAFGIGAQVGVLLPNSRKQEYEADHLGLLFAAMAGYNPKEAIPFWQRMSQASGSGSKPPEFLATHPADENRIKKLEGYMNEALSLYKPVK